MEFDRTSSADRALELRARTTKTQERLEQPADATVPPVRPEHGGATAMQPTGHEPKREDPARERRRQAMSVVARFLSLPGETELDIEVDVRNEQVTFQIRDRNTGELLREVPEGEAKTLMEKLREFGGTLVDRAL
jgi:uncharacterized FlaG/YvyC family protein